MSEIYTFEKGPVICITLIFKELQLQSARLTITNRFEARFEGVAGKAFKDELLAFLDSYSKREHLKVEPPLQGLTPFRRKTLKHLQNVPFGSTISYGDLSALSSGHPRAARAVGSACHCNPFPLIIPCHRVVAKGGKIGGFAYGLEMKKILLDFEGT